MQGQITHIFIEGNVLVDALTNEVIESQQTKEYHRFIDLPTSIRRCINMDKTNS